MGRMVGPLYIHTYMILSLPPFPSHGPSPSSAFFLPIGVHSVCVALLGERADITYSPNDTDPDHLVSYINGLGFTASLLSHGDISEEGKVDLEVQSSTIPYTTCFNYMYMI